MIMGADGPLAWPLAIFVLNDKPSEMGHFPTAPSRRRKRSRPNRRASAT